jgi:hypothetical protein
LCCSSLTFYCCGSAFVSADWSLAACMHRRNASTARQLEAETSWCQARRSAGADSLSCVAAVFCCPVFCLIVFGMWFVSRALVHISELWNWECCTSLPQCANDQ